MELPPFALDHWLAAHEFATPPISYNLASSTGPAWTLGDVLALGSEGSRPLALGDVRVTYAPPEGRHELRKAIAEFHDVDPDWVVVTTGASEALSALLCLASKPGGNLLIPSPAFPAFAVMAQAWGLETTILRNAGARTDFASRRPAFSLPSTATLCWRSSTRRTIRPGRSCRGPRPRNWRPN